jgi:hypothetical protein
VFWRPRESCIEKYHAFLIALCSISVSARVLDKVELDVPVVKQGHALCGPATIEMVFRYWGISEYDQYDIAYNILLFNPEAKRVKRSGILETSSIEWERYPGTGTSTMRAFLKQFSKTKNHKYKRLSGDNSIAEKQKTKIWSIVQEYLSHGIPVIVHQYWRGASSRGHYRLVTGYDQSRKKVYLNDASPGKKITQSYKEFFKLWNVDEPWLHYNAIAFNTDGNKPYIDLVKYIR